MKPDAKLRPETAENPQTDCKCKYAGKAITRPHWLGSNSFLRYVCGAWLYLSQGAAFRRLWEEQFQKAVPTSDAAISAGTGSLVW